MEQKWHEWWQSNFAALLEKASDVKTTLVLDTKTIPRGDLFRAIQALPIDKQKIILRACLNSKTPLGKRFANNHFLERHDKFLDQIEAHLCAIDDTYRAVEKPAFNFLSGLLWVQKKVTAEEPQGPQIKHAVETRL